MVVTRGVFWARLRVQTRWGMVKKAEKVVNGKIGTKSKSKDDIRRQVRDSEERSDDDEKSRE